LRECGLAARGRITVDRPTLRQRVWDLLELTEHPESGVAQFDWVDVSLLTLICLNVLAVVLETVPWIADAYGEWLRGFDVFSVGVFTVEYLVRLWACTADPRYAHPLTGRLRYATSFMGVVDVVAIAPFYVPMLIPFDLRFVRVLRLLRLFRILKIGRYSEALDRLSYVLRRKRADLLVALVALLILLIFASSVMYLVESEAQPQKYSSIPAAMWWGISALTTVGYGDVYPVTPLGKLMASLISLAGIALFALPAAILTSGFADEADRRRRDTGRCPYCGTVRAATEGDETTNAE
jgi:voltage-gated potassium channel